MPSSIDLQSSDTTPPVELRQRVRVTYEKGELVKFISHQDEFRLWERTLRRADLPLLYKQGFNPQPHMQFASPLGVGFTGLSESLDITLSATLPLDELTARLRAKLPPGVTLHHLVEVPLKTESLQNLLLGADYTIILYAEPGEIGGELLQERIDAFLATGEIWRERERKGQRYTYNLRPLIFELRYDGYDAQAEEHRIFLRVQQRAGATGRPDEVLSSMGLDDFARTLRRDHLYLADDPTDVAIFAAYPVVEQAAISAPAHSAKSKAHAALQQPQHGPVGRSINERAGDEFV
jgi:radical SAM-linked protein